MTHADALADAATESAGIEFRGRVFGLQVQMGAAGDAAADGVTVAVEAPGALRRQWSAPARDLAVRGGRPGRPMLRIEQEDGGAYRMWAPGHGRHWVSADGTLIRAAVPRPPDRRWLRLFLAQPLPLAAALQGYELFHASAVQLGETVVGFIAESGTGKTSLAAQLVGRGGGFVTDDVLALNVADGDVLAHAGPRWLCLDDQEAASLTDAERLLLGPTIGRSDKLHFAPPTVTAPAPVKAVFYLHRDEDVERLEFAEIDVIEPSRLFQSVFLSYVDSPEVLVRTLDFCAQFARLVRPFEVRVPSSLGSGVLADEVLAFVERELR